MWCQFPTRNRRGAYSFDTASHPLRIINGVWNSQVADATLASFLIAKPPAQSRQGPITTNQNCAVMIFVRFLDQGCV